MMMTRKQEAAASARTDPGEALAAIPGFEEGRKLQARILELGERLRALRTDELGLSQTAAARAIGIDQSELSRIENGIGSRGPSYGTIAKIIEAYQEVLSAGDSGIHLGLSIQLRHEEDGAVEQQILAGSG